MKAMRLFSCLYVQPAAIHFRNNDKMLILSEIRVFPFTLIETAQPVI